MERVRVGCKVDEEEVDDELDYLNPCDPFLPPDADAPGGLEVVPVHDDMDCQVECDGNITLVCQSSLGTGIVPQRYAR